MTFNSDCAGARPDFGKPLQQLPWTNPRECVRCHRLTHEPRLCGQCRADDEIVTRASARALRFALDSFSVWLGYDYSLDQTEATTDWLDHCWPTIEEQQDYWQRKEGAA